MNEGAEFAEMYGKRERIRFVVAGVGVGVVLAAASKAWFFLWLREFSESAPCREVFGLNGALALYFGLFAGLPLLAALCIGLTLGRRGYRILKDGQVPPIGEKVFRPTRIERGAKAKLVGWIQLLCAAPALALAIWGLGQAANLTQAAQGKDMRCVALTVDHH